jgi:ketosteroid isomerase-like protein
MRRRYLWPSVLLTVGALTPLHADPPALDALVASERAFSAMSVEKGMKEAFVANLADDAIVFAPLPVNGKKTWEARKPPRGTLIWEPHVAEVAAAGDMGFTMGPWERRPPSDAADTTVFHGHFMTVWQRQPGGAWKAALDAGISHPPDDDGLGSGRFEPGPSHAVAGGSKPVDPKKARLALMSLDRAFARPAAANGVAQAFAALAAEDVRYLHEGSPPARGREAACDAMGRLDGSVTWRPIDGRVAKSGDLGFTYGIVESRGADLKAAPDSSTYVHVWRKGDDRRWRIVIAQEDPLPKPAKK